jgi:hypothetical protein
LIDARSDQLWAQSYEQEVEDVLALQRTVARDIAAAVNAELTADERRAFSRVKTVQLPAHENYLKGQLRLHDNPSEAIRYFERAIEFDPKYAEAYAGLAEAG